MYDIEQFDEHETTNPTEVEEDEEEEEEEEDIEVEDVLDEDEDDDEDEVQATADQSTYRTKSGRVTHSVDQYEPSMKGQSYNQCHLHTQSNDQTEYDTEHARLIANVMTDMNERAKCGNLTEHSFVESFSLKKGLKKFGQQGYEAAFGEMKQLHDRTVFKPIDVSKLTQQEKQRSLESLIFLVEKRDGRIKARTCANGSKQRDWMEREETTSPTATTESIILTAVIDAEEHRDVATVDIPHAFVQTPIPEQAPGERIIMKIRGPLVDMLVEMDPTTYRDKYIYEKGTKVLYVVVCKAIYGMLQSHGS